MSISYLGRAVYVCTLVLSATVVQAKVSAEEAERLGKDLTCTGAIKAGNAEGTIPEFSGKWIGTPPALDFKEHVGAFQPDPYSNEKPLFNITAANLDKYADKLTEGQKALLKKFPDSMKLPIFPGRRDFRYADEICAVVKRNALESEVSADGNGFKGYMGALNFPIPKNGMELFWNTAMPARADTEVIEQRDLVLVDSGGDHSLGRTRYIQLSRYDSAENLGKPVGGELSLVTNETLLPEREKGSVILAVEPQNYDTDKRLAWSYDPGTRRVRQLPAFGFDQPQPGSGGKITLDSDRLFNGSPERYEWISHGKRELFIPANAFRLHQPIKYADLLKTGHPNPKYTRYELRRVWMLEGKLKPGYRHLYSRRVMFLDEDTGHAVVSDMYDARGQLWQHAELHYYYAFDIKKWHSGSAFYYDLQSGSYAGLNMFQERAKGPILGKGGLKSSQFTPEVIRNMGN